MSDPRQLPLFDPGSQPPTWNERLAQGEYAVHFSDFEDSAKGEAPFCLAFESLPAAEQYAVAEVARRPGLRCRIYDQNGFTGAPIREFKGDKYRDNTDLSPRFRRWGGSILFFGGLVLSIVDWSFGFRFLWPSMLGTRMILPGAMLLITEGLVMLYARRSKSRIPTEGKP